MKRFKLVLKGILLWVTLFTNIIFVSGVDSIYDAGYFIPAIIICVILCYACNRLISEKEYKKIIPFSKWL